MKGRVLVVDDDQALAEMLGIVLQKEGLEVSHVADGAQAVEAFREAGATTLTVVPMALDAPGRLRLVEQFREMC